MMAKDYKTLHLVLKRKWWDMIASGEKKEEYREICPYWANRLLDDHPLPVKGYWDSVIPRHLSQRTKYPYINTLIFWYGTRGYEQVCFHLGYTKTTMTYAIDGIDERTGREEWGAEPNREYFVIKLGERIE